MAWREKRQRRASWYRTSSSLRPFLHDSGSSPRTALLHSPLPSPQRTPWNPAPTSELAVPAPAPRLGRLCSTLRSRVHEGLRGTRLRPPNSLSPLRLLASDGSAPLSAPESTKDSVEPDSLPRTSSSLGPPILPRRLRGDLPARLHFGFGGSRFQFRPQEDLVSASAPPWKVPVSATASDFSPWLRNSFTSTTALRLGHFLNQSSSPVPLRPWAFPTSAPVAPSVRDCVDFGRLCSGQAVLAPIVHIRVGLQEYSRLELCFGFGSSPQEALFAASAMARDAHRAPSHLRRPPLSVPA